MCLCLQQQGLGNVLGGWLNCAQLSGPHLCGSELPLEVGKERLQWLLLRASDLLRCCHVHAADADWLRRQHHVIPLS